MPRARETESTSRRQAPPSGAAGPLVRSVARNKHYEARGDARVEVEYKLATRARDQLDAEIRPLLTESAQRFETEQLATLKRLGMEMAPLALATWME